MIGLFGGAFDPPHVGHVALVRAAKEQLGLDRVRVLVAAQPAHKEVSTPAEVRLALAAAAFPGEEVELDPHGRTIELLEAHPDWNDTVFLVGADQFCDFLDWERPDDVLERTELGVATRPGFPRERLDAVLSSLVRPERVRLFDMPPSPVASSDLRARLEAGEDVGAELPSAVADMIRAGGLYHS